MRYKFYFFPVLLILLIVSLSISGCTAKAATKTPQVQQTQPIRKISTIDAQRAFKLINDNKNNSNFVIIDVRTPDEYKRGHIEGSKLINFYSDNFKDNLAKLDRNKKYLVYCRSGSRSSRAVKFMSQLQFEQVYNLNGGIIDWKNAQLPLKK